MCTKKRAGIGIFVIAIGVVIFNFPKIFEYTWKQDDPNISDCIIVNETDFANTAAYQNIYL